MTGDTNATFIGNENSTIIYTPPTGDATLLSSYKVPDRIEFCDSLPVTKTGKLFKRELKEQARALAAASEEMR